MITEIVNNGNILTWFNAQRLDHVIEDIEDTLFEKNLPPQTLILDMLCSNGYNSRFASIEWNGVNLDIHSFRGGIEVDSSTVEAANRAYIDKLECLSNCVLTRPQKFLFRKKIESLR